MWYFIYCKVSLLNDISKWQNTPYEKEPIDEIRSVSSLYGLSLKQNKKAEVANIQQSAIDELISLPVQLMAYCSILTKNLEHI